MIKLFNNVMGTIDSCPYAPRSKQDLLGIGSIISGGASVLGNLLGFGSSQSANETNLQIARETNAQNYKMFQEQQAFNEQMWNKQNEYNLPANVAKRLLEAGINPSAVFGSGSVTPAGQLTSPNANPMQAAHVSPYSFDLTGVGQAVNSYFQNQLVNAEKKRTNAETAHTEFLTMEGNKKLLPTLEFLENQSKKEGVLGDIARSQLRYAQDSYFWKLKQLRNEVRAQDDQSRFMAEKTYEQRLQNGLMEVQLAYAPKLNEAQLRQYYATVSQLKAQIGLINSNRMLTDEQRKHEIEKKTGQIIQNGLSGLSFELRKATQDYVEQQTIYETKQLINEVEDYNSSWWNRTIQGYIPFASGSATAATRRAMYKW